MGRVLADRDDLSLVANIRTRQIQKLQASGIATLTALANSTLDSIPGMLPSVFDRLRRQASCQKTSEGKATPVYEVIERDPDRPGLGFGRLPPCSRLDVCFDIEGYPLVDGGLEYLLGATFEDNGQIKFRDWWAHDADEEKTSFQAFVQWVYARWREDPGMHIYHYAAYEPTVLKRLMSRYAVCETEVDDLLRNGVFVDLYAVVRQALIIGEPAYSLKNVEHLYKTNRRSSEVKTAGDSMVWYHRWREQRDGDEWRSSAVLHQIRDYNEADCRSTMELVAWLRHEQIRSGIPFVLASSDVKEQSAATTGRAALAQAMLAEVPSGPQPREDWRIHSLIAHLLEFHRREEKPSWWLRFERLAMTEEELFDDGDCLAELERTNRLPLHVRRSLAVRVPV